MCDRYAHTIACASAGHNRLAPVGRWRQRPHTAEFSALLEGKLPGKSDGLTVHFAQIGEDLPLGTTTGSTDPSAPLVGYTLSLAYGEILKVDASGSYFGYVGIYGKKEDGTYGKALTWAWLVWDDSRRMYGASITFTAGWERKYLLIVGSPYQASFDFELNATCLKGQCRRTWCVYDGEIYEDGKTFVARDDCNTCQCNDCTLACSEEMCTAITCDRKGESFALGQRYDDGCARCTCREDGTFHCINCCSPHVSCL